MLCQIGQSRALRGQKVKLIPHPARSLIYLIFIMHDFVICYRVLCKEAENKRSGKNLGAWAKSDDQFGHLLGSTTYLILLYSKLCGKFPFIITNIFFLYDLTKISSP